MEDTVARNDFPLMLQFRTGQKVSRIGHYYWLKYADGSKLPAPTPAEKTIHLRKGEEVPAVGSCDKPAWYRFLA